ncbi:unnamed protein product, partial [Polarella glacialis]
VAQLTAAALLQRVVMRRLPFNRRASSVADLAELLAAEAAKTDAGEFTVRVSARPRKLEAMICKALKPELLSPARYTHTLSVSPDCGEAGGSPASLSEQELRFSLIPRAMLDPTAYSEARRAEDSARAYWRCAEVALRWPQRFQGVEAVALWSDGSGEDTSGPWLLRWADEFLPVGAPAAELRPKDAKEGSSGWGSSFVAGGELEVHPLRGSWHAIDGQVSGARGLGDSKVSKGGKKGGKKKMGDPFLKKEWYDIKAPSMFSVRNCGKTLITRTQGTKIATEELKGRVLEVNLADLNNDEDQASKKIKLCIEEVQGRNCLTDFHGMELTRDKICSMIQKFQSLIEAHVDVKTTDGVTVRMFVIAFTKKRPDQVKTSCYAQSAQIRQIAQGI